MPSRDPKDLTLETQAKLFAFRERMDAEGIPWIITSTRRTEEEQKALYAQGRHPLNVVNDLRVKAGMAPITDKQNARPVTWTMKSKHIDGLAFDIAILKDAKPTWEEKVDVDLDAVPDYTEAGMIGEAVGLVWGGRFRNKKGLMEPDFPHFQYDEKKEA
jgi:peptidoglycan L-alanyl-D-glutamate endopeptidase CwlK